MLNERTIMSSQKAWLGKIPRHKTNTKCYIIPQKLAVAHPKGRDTRGTSKHFIWVRMGMNETGSGSVGCCFDMHQSRYESNQNVQAGFRSGSLIHFYGSEKKYLRMWNTDLDFRDSKWFLFRLLTVQATTLFSYFLRIYLSTVEMGNIEHWG